MQFLAALALISTGVILLHALAYRHRPEQWEGITEWLVAVTSKVPGATLGLIGLGCLTLGFVVGVV